MSRSDFPLGYDDSHSPLYGPQGGNYPPPPAYGFPANGGPPSGQPSSFYPPGPHGPPYPGQPAGYPAGPYPGQPYPGGPGYNNQPMMPPMPPIIPPTMPSSALSGDGEGFAAGSFDSLKVRHSFIRKVYMILASQLLVTVAIVAVFICWICQEVCDRKPSCLLGIIRCVFRHSHCAGLL